VHFVFSDPLVAEVTWDSPAGPVGSYQVAFGRNDSGVLKTWQVQGMQQFLAPFLERGKMYEFKVAAKFGGKLGEYAKMTKQTPMPKTGTNLILWFS
jgi:hypothetical protein